MGLEGTGNDVEGAEVNNDSNMADVVKELNRVGFEGGCSNCVIMVGDANKIDFNTDWDARTAAYSVLIGDVQFNFTIDMRTFAFLTGSMAPGEVRALIMPLLQSLPDAAKPFYDDNNI